nr:CheR family methyltransferase [Propylenella binzhouense]
MVVGIGASGGSIESLQTLLAGLANLSDVAEVVVLQSREALDEAALRQALGPDLPLVTAEQGMAIEAGTAYLAPPSALLTVAGGRFAISHADGRSRTRGTLDSFFLSLAEDRGEAAVAILLSGTGSDGILAVAAVKEHGGLAIAERGPPEDAREAAHNLPAALADFVIPAAEMPGRLALHARLRRRSNFDALIDQGAKALSSIAKILRTKTGHDFHGYKKQTFLRRVQRRMQVTQIEDLDEYVKLLRDQPEEVQNLFNDLLIGVTHFFRDPKEFDALEKEVVPKLVEGKGTGDLVRVWVLGCATGEEAYSIAILLREEIARRDVAPQVQIFATDIDVRALAAARAGRFSGSIVNNVSPERLARWFVREGNTYVVAKELREMCIFSAHNVIRDAPFSRLDLISCRNLLIYLEADLQSRIIPLFHFALRPGGFLFLGNSENVTRHPKLFEPIDRRARIFRRLDNGPHHLPDFPITASARRPPEARPAPVRSQSDGQLAQRAERIVEQYAPAYVITTEDFQVLHFSARTGRYIEPTAGAATLDLLNLVHRDLRLELRALLMKAGEEDKAVHAERIKMRVSGHTTLLVDIAVEPIRNSAQGVRNFVVVFKDGLVLPEGGADLSAVPGHLRDEHVLRLESELRLTRERLQATIEELETANEELKSSNEEYQSLNEELQSANEELETSREELQSVNEELTTVNSELASRVHDLTRATSDLKNFLESTQIPTLFLDNDLKVMNFTPASTELFHLVETDIGRPIAHIKSRIAFEELQDDVRRVLRTLNSVERSIENPATGARYIVRILPDRSIDNFIAGVVVTFVDVTALKRSEERQRLLLSELQHRVRNTLGVVRSIAHRTAETSDSVEDFAMHLDGRINALARVQAAVTRDPVAGVSLDTMVADELVGYAAHEGEQVAISGPPIRLQPKAAEMLGLAVHELATNAVKYGALRQPHGKIRIAWALGGEGGERTLAFDWSESCPDPVDSAPKRHGFGMELLEKTLEYELSAKASLDFRKEGLHCRIEMPVTDRLLVQHKPAS